MRSSGATKFELFLSVVALTKSTMAFFAAPSFHEGSGSAGAVAAGWPVLEFEGAEFVEQPGSMSSVKSRTNVAKRVFMMDPLCVEGVNRAVSCYGPER